MSDIIETKQDKDGVFVSTGEIIEESRRTLRPRVLKSYNVRKKLVKSSKPSLTGVKQVDEFFEGFSVGLNTVNRYRKYLGIF